MKIRKSLMLCVLAVLALAWATPARASTILYFDDFSGAGALPLNGTTPDITMGAATWTAYVDGATPTNGYRDNGYIPEWWDGYKTATLPFNPQNGKVYTLSVTVMDADPFNIDPYSGDPIGLTFFGGPGLKIYDTSGQVYSTGGPSADVLEATVGQSAISAAIVLDTQAAAWTAEWFVNGASVRGPEAYTTNPTIATIGLWKDWKPGRWDDFKLEVVPEPATMALMALGGLGLLLRRKRSK